MINITENTIVENELKDCDGILLTPGFGERAVEGMIKSAEYALENRVPIVACNTFGSYSERLFLGCSKIISFYKGHISPSKLKIIEGPKNSSGFICSDIDLDYPKKLRKIRLGEKINKNKIKVKFINNK